MIKEIWCMHHSHLDVGYTHPAPLIMELQVDYIDQAIDLCLKTENYPVESQFRWTIEATSPLTMWLETASKERFLLLKDLIKKGKICVAALPMHTTSCCTMPEMIEMVKNLDLLRDLLETKIDAAINHDVNGQPWTFSQVLLDSGINFYLTGINIHFGGIPLPRPAAFNWQTPDNRKLTTFLGEHYSLFSQFLFTSESSTKKMHEGVKEYVERLDKSGYDRDFAFLTATNPPLYDNNCPDVNLADLIKKYNEENHEQKIRFVTLEMLRDKIKNDGIENLPTHSGDWTDYWNFGCGSTARETMISRRAKRNIQKSDMIESVLGSLGNHYNKVRNKVWEDTFIFDEHTWGAAQSVSNPFDIETLSQQLHKNKMSYQSSELSAYLMSTSIEKLANNPTQCDKIEGIMLVNPTKVKQNIKLEIPSLYFKNQRQLSAIRTRDYIPYINPETTYCGYEEVEPFSFKKIKLTTLLEKAEKLKPESNYSVTNDEIITPFYKIKYNGKNGRIIQLFDVKRNIELLDEKSNWSMFELVKETIDGRFLKEERSSIFPRDLDLGNRNISVWNHDWNAKRQGVNRILNWEIVKKADEVSLIWETEIEGMTNIRQIISFSTVSPQISMKVSFLKTPVVTPESFYFAFPLKMKENWKCKFDSGENFVELDKDQLGNVCRDWATVDKSVSVYGDEFCATLFCPDAPMVQIGDFNFGKMNRSIERKENPLLLAWTLNNLWDTNFMANQSGVMEFNYSLEIFDNFDEDKVYKSSLEAEKMWAIGPIVDFAKEDNFTFIKGEELPVYTKLNKDKDGAILIFKNFKKDNISCKFTMPNHEILEANFATPQEKSIKNISVVNNSVEFTISSNGLKIIKLKLRKVDNHENRH